MWGRAWCDLDTRGGDAALQALSGTCFVSGDGVLGTGCGGIGIGIRATKLALKGRGVPHQQKSMFGRGCSSRLV